MPMNATRAYVPVARSGHFPALNLRTARALLSILQFVLILADTRSRLPGFQHTVAPGKRDRIKRRDLGFGQSVFCGSLGRRQSEMR